MEAVVVLVSYIETILFWNEHHPVMFVLHEFNCRTLNVSVYGAVVFSGPSLTPVLCGPHRLSRCFSLSYSTDCQIPHKALHQYDPHLGEIDHLYVFVPSSCGIKGERTKEQFSLSSVRSLTPLCGYCLDSFAVTLSSVYEVKWLLGHTHWVLWHLVVKEFYFYSRGGEGLITSMPLKEV